MAVRDHHGVDESRVGDEDRQRAVRDLTKHCGDGRLTLEELEQRITEAYAALTEAELRHALRELPASPAPMVPPSKPPMRTKPSAAPVRQSASKGAEVALKVHVAVYLSVITFLCVIWFLTTPFGYFWPVWPAVGWGLAVVIQAGVTKAVCRD